MQYYPIKIVRMNKSAEIQKGFLCSGFFKSFEYIRENSIHFLNFLFERRLRKWNWLQCIWHLRSPGIIMLWLLEDTLHSPTLANCWAVNTNGNASNISFHVSDEKSERAELPRNRFVAGDFQGVALNFWHPWGVLYTTGNLVISTNMFSFYLLI